MYLKNMPLGIAKLRDDIEMARRGGDPELVTQAYRAYAEAREAGGAYFRLNIFGMSEYRELMEELGMGYWANEMMPDWPEPGDFDVPMDAEDEMLDEQSVEYEAWQASCDEVRGWNPEPQSGIALHKFTSNDGWWVTALECKTALELYDDDVEGIVEGRMDTGEFDDEYWLEWLAFLQRAADSDGFSVY